MLAQVVSIPDHHPVEMSNCLVKIDIFTGTCGSNTVLNRRNYAKINQLIYSGVYSPTPQACSEALITGSLTWQTPQSGTYPGQSVTTALQDNFAQGHVYPYGSPDDIKCSGVFWISPSGSGLFNAVLDIRYQLTVKNVWANVHLRSGTLTIQDSVSFNLQSANTFKRDKPKDLGVPPRYNNVLKKDVERSQLLVRLGEVITPAEHRIIFQEGLSNDDKLEAVVRDPKKAALFNELLIRHFQDLYHTNTTYRHDRYSRESTSPLSWFNDRFEGLFVVKTELIPETHCDSMREIRRITDAKFYRSERNETFSDIVTFSEGQSNTGLAAVLANKTIICGEELYTLQLDNLYLNMPKSHEQFLSIPKAKERFLSQSLSFNSKVTSVATAATLQLMNVAKSVDYNFCNLHRNIIQNRINLITSGQAHIQDQHSVHLQTVVAGESIFTLRCQQILAVARDEQNVCCMELPIYIWNEESQDFTKKAYMQPYSRKVSPFCNARICSKSFPASWNVTETEPAFYYSTNGSVYLTNSSLPPYDPDSLSPTEVTAVIALDLLDKTQREEIDTIFHLGQAREAIQNTIAIGVVNTMDTYLPPVVNPAKDSVPADLLGGIETFLSQNPVTALISRLPRILQTIIAIGSTVLLIYAGGHLVFLIYFFFSKLELGCKKSYFTHFAPTMQLQSLTQDNISQNSAIDQLQQRVAAMEEQNRALRTRVATIENDNNNNQP